MSDKKAIYHKQLQDSPRYLNPNKIKSFIKSQDQKKIQNKYTTHTNNLNISQQLSMNKQYSVLNNNLLSNIIKNSIAKSFNPHQREINFQQPGILTSKEKFVRSTFADLHKNKSEIIEPQKTPNKFILEQVRFNEVPRQKNKKIAVSPSKIYSLCHSQTKNTSLGSSPFLICKGNSKQDILVELHNKSKTNFSKKHQSTSYVTLSTIKEKIQKYLSEESNYSHDKNAQLVMQQKSSLKLKLSDDQSNQAKIRNGILSSQYSLTKKKQAKHALDMMKRRLNFSQVNKSLKNQEFPNQAKSKSKINNLLNKNQIQKQLTQTQQNQSLNQQVFLALQDQPQLFNALQSQILINLRNKTSEHNLTKPDQINKDHVEITDNTLLSDNSDSNLRNNLKTEIIQKKLKKKQYQGLQIKNKEYLYNLYYYPNLQNKSSLENKSKFTFNQQPDNYIEKYKEWKKENQTQLKLKQLLKASTNPVDPIQCYYDSFINQKSCLQSINSFIQQQKCRSPQFLCLSNSSSLSPLHKKIINKGSISNQKQNQILNPLKLQQKIIFVSKKHKLSIKKRKLSSLLLKLQKHNIQIQRMNRIQSIKNQKPPNSKFKSSKIHGLDISNYVQQQTLSNLTLTNPKNFNNFIVQWPKKDHSDLKESNVTNLISKKKYSQDWTSFEPWKNNLNNGTEEEITYDKILTNQN